MLPLIPLAVTLVPELIRLIAGDKAGIVATDVAGAVKAVTGTDDGAVAQCKLDADPAMVSDLRVRLAQIALESQKARDAADDGKRIADLEALRQAIGDTQQARASFGELAKAGSPLAWGAPVVSVIVTGGFFLIVLLLLWGRDVGRPFDPTITSIINLTIGALAASFATVVNFWLGSSQGSRDKDTAMRDLQTAQMKLQVHHPAPAAPPAPVVPPPSPITAAATLPRQKGAAADNFDRCLSIILEKEGGYSDLPADRGGPTQMGITRATLADWRGHAPDAITPDDVRDLTRREAAEIYRAKYWLPMRCNDLPPGIDLMVFDFGVNTGPRNSVKLLQRSVGVTDDGSIGPRTLAAVNAASRGDVIDTLVDGRLAYYKSLDTYTVFGAGWNNRTHQVASLAQAMRG